jgi:hypothetical protein
MGRDSVVCLSTCYGLEGPGIESRLGRGFPLPSRQALEPTQPTVQRVPGLFVGVKQPGRGVDHPPHPAPMLEKEYSYTSNPLWESIDCSRLNFTFVIIIIIITTTATIQHGVWLCSSVWNLSRFVTADANFPCDKSVVLGDTIKRTPRKWQTHFTYMHLLFLLSDMKCTFNAHIWSTLTL